jgi:cytochrome c
MKPLPTKATLVPIKIPVSSSTALGGGNPETGQSVFAARCAAAQATEPGINKNGPSLASVVGSKSAAASGFSFSTAIKEANVTCGEANRDEFLANPTRFIHGTKMFVNLPGSTDRENVTAYLGTLKK